jgi:hypothetical protein
MEKRKRSSKGRAPGIMPITPPSAVNVNPETERSRQLLFNLRKENLASEPVGKSARPLRGSGRCSYIQAGLRTGTRECAILAYAAKRAELPVTRLNPKEAYGVTSERKCLASFSIRFN